MKELRECQCEYCTCKHDFEDITDPTDFRSDTIELRCKICGVIQYCGIDF